MDFCCGRQTINTLPTNYINDRKAGKKGLEEEKSDHFHSVVREDLSEEMAFTVRKSGTRCFASAF